MHVQYRIRVHIHIHIHIHIYTAHAKRVKQHVQLPGSAIPSARIMDLRDASIMSGLLRSTCWKSHAERSMPAAIPSVMNSPTFRVRVGVGV